MTLLGTPSVPSVESSLVFFFWYFTPNSVLGMRAQLRESQFLNSNDAKFFLTMTANLN